ncbi:hypothetical protein BDM02DRAFT_3123568 [Thelephora ganbajun]|uniref:Uncharacterized protein n=1 Tax=Thelephora ganbajun TaxID=370292 RepID=A0ACB6Z0X3_THEGA|nr:hypothetical protein BDM02DRAFT_3123568 [Thelephora ganbajun]
MSTWRFQPYGTPRARFDEHRNAEAGPSALVPLPALYLAPPTTNPPRGSSEATADAVSDQTNTEEDTAPVSNFYCSRALEAQENRAVIAFAMTETSANCVSGHNGGGTFQDSQATKARWAVSADAVT